MICFTNPFNWHTKQHDSCNTIEIHANESYPGPCADIWSLGVILYTIVTGELPFQVVIPIFKYPTHSKHQSRTITRLSCSTESSKYNTHCPITFRQVWYCMVADLLMAWVALIYSEILNYIYLFQFDWVVHFLVLNWLLLHLLTCHSHSTT